MVEISDYAFPRSVVQTALSKLGKPLLQTLKPVPLISFRLLQSMIPRPFATVVEGSHQSAVQESTTQLGRLSHVDGGITTARCIINSGEGPPSVARFELCTGYAILPNNGRFSMPEVQIYGMATTSGAHTWLETLIPKVLRKGGY